MSDELFKYIYEAFSNDISYKEFAKRHHINNYIIPKEQTDVINRCLKIKKQKVLYEMFTEVANIINSCAKELNIPIAFVKGVFLESKYFEDHYLREIRDIDIIVSRDNIQNLLLKCQEAGLFQNYSVKQIETICNQQSDNFHHIDLSTEFIYRGVIFSFKVEFHYNFFDKRVHELFESHCSFIQSVLKDLEHITINGYSFPILSIENDILFVMAHAVKHFVWDFTRGYNSHTEYYLSISNFYDVNRMLTHVKSIEKLRKHAIQKNLYEEFLFSIYVDKVFFCTTIYDIRDIRKMILEINPYSRWVSFFTFFIGKIDTPSLLLSSISTIAKKALSFSNADNNINTLSFVDKNENRIYLDVLTRDGSIKMILHDQQNIIDDQIKIKIILLKSLNQCCVEKSFEVNLNNCNFVSGNQIKGTIEKSEIHFQLLTDYLVDCLYDKKIYLKFSITHKENIYVPEGFSQSKYSFVCLEIKNEKNL